MRRVLCAGLAVTAAAVLLACVEGVTPDCGNAAVCAPSDVASDGGVRDALPSDAGDDRG
jgi:hypothetical protein